MSRVDTVEYLHHEALLSISLEDLSAKDYYSRPTTLGDYETFCGLIYLHSSLFQLS